MNNCPYCAEEIENEAIICKYCGFDLTGKMEKVACPICGNESNDIYWVESGFIARRCACKVIFVSPRPTHDEILDLYSTDAGLVSASDHISDEIYKRLHAKHSLNVIRKYIQRGKLLEIGAGGGYFAHEAKKAGFEVVVIEPNLSLHEHLRNRLNLSVVCNLEELRASGLQQNIDIIYHCDVISHFANPLDEFVGFAKLLPPAGFMFFETGNGGELSTRWISFFGGLELPEHLYNYSPTSINKLCQLTGFHLLDLKRYNTVPYVIFLKYATPLRKWVMVFSIRKMLRGNRNIRHQEQITPDPENRDTPQDNLVKENFALPGRLNSGPTTVIGNVRKYISQNLYISCMFFFRYRIGQALSLFGGPHTDIYITQR